MKCVLESKLLKYWIDFRAHSRSASVHWSKTTWMIRLNLNSEIQNVESTTIQQLPRWCLAANNSYVHCFVIEKLDFARVALAIIMLLYLLLMRWLSKWLTYVMSAHQVKWDYYVCTFVKCNYCTMSYFQIIVFVGIFMSFTLSSTNGKFKYNLIKLWII